MKAKKAIRVFGYVYAIAFACAAVAAEAAKETQRVSIAEESILFSEDGRACSFELWYDVSDENASLSGIGFVVFFDSEALKFKEVSAVKRYSEQIFLRPEEASVDTLDLDGDPKTDRYVRFAWADLTVDWPGSAVELPVFLARLEFVVPDDFKGAETVVRVRVTETDPAYDAFATEALIDLKGEKAND